MKKHVLRALALLLVIGLLLPLTPPRLARAEGDEEGEKTVYDDGTGYTFDYECTGEATDTPDEPPAIESSGVALEPMERSAPAPSLAELAAQEPGHEAAAAVSGLGKAPKQLTMDDIHAMNPGATVIDIYTNEGYLSTLVGKYYDKKVENVEDGVKSIQPMAALLGLGKGCDFFAVYSETNNTGYTFYTYQQRYGGLTLRYATLRIIVDPQGYTAGLSCSFVPNAGTAPKEPAITKEQAEAFVAKKFAQFDLTWYTDHTVLLAVPYDNRVVNCYVVYSNNPDATVSFDMPYYEHLVTTDGQYLTILPASTFATGNGDAIDNSRYFEGMEVEYYSATVQLQDGTTRDVTVPVSYNARDKKYYLMDPSRKIAVAQYYDFNYRNTVNFVTSSTLDGWSDNNLLAYANYIVLYDFYADHGIRSVDGFGTPILITVGWCEKDRTPVNNACFYGVNQGWACFGVSDINHYCDCVDVMGHEYTHGVTWQSMQGCFYRNETGAINEAYSDIMGNLAEMSLDYTEDRSWLVGERTGGAIRDMGDPNRFEQPAFVGDVYYLPPVLDPVTNINDNGGIHSNNSLLGHIAYLMDKAGMSYEQQIGMWLTSIEIITPLSDYQDLHGALLFALKINGLLEEYGPALNQAFAAAGLNEDWTKTYLEAKKDGCGRITFSTDGDIAASTAQAYFLNLGTNKLTVGVPDVNGVVSMLLPAGNYRVLLIHATDDRTTNYRYTTSGWSTSGGSYAAVKVKAGAVVELPGTAEKSSSKYKPLKLVQYNGGYFSMKIPQGWKVETLGQYGNWCVKIYDPSDRSTQMFLYNGLAPYLRSESSRRYWNSIDELVGLGPVLTSADVLGVLNCWNFTGSYQAYVDGKKHFDDLYDLHVLGGIYYDGPYAENGSDAVESAAFVHGSTDYDGDCFLALSSALVNEDTDRIHGANAFYTLYDLAGVMAPTDRYAEVFDDLVTCLLSIRFTDAYIAASQKSQAPMQTDDAMAEHRAFLGDVLAYVYDKYAE